MYRLTLKMQKEKKYIIMFIVYMAFFSTVYFMLDYLSGGYKPMIEDHGYYLVIINIILNLLMASSSALMFNLSTAQHSLTKKGERTGYLSFLSVVLGFFTYGCTSCIVTFLGVIGISFSVYLLPLKNLPYKLLGLVILIISIFVQRYLINNTKCKIWVLYFFCKNLKKE